MVAFQQSQALSHQPPPPRSLRSYLGLTTQHAYQPSHTTLWPHKVFCQNLQWPHALL